MAYRSQPRVIETTTTTGVGPLALAGALSAAFIRFSAVPGMSVGDVCRYYIEAVDSSGVPTGEWEAGLGTYSAANQLTRSQVIFSSNGGAAVNLSAGTKRVGMTLLSDVATLLSYAMPSTVIEVTYPINTITVAAPATFTFSDATPDTGSTMQLHVTNGGATPLVLTVPSAWSDVRQANITSMVLPASGRLHVSYLYNGATWEITGDPPYSSRMDATAAPTVNDDVSDGYGPGSQWLDTNTGIAYLCQSAAAGAAVWVTLNPPVELALDDLIDVSASSPTANDLLAWNGTEWVNTPKAAVARNVTGDTNAAVAVTASGTGGVSVGNTGASAGPVSMQSRTGLQVASFTVTGGATPEATLSVYPTSFTFSPIGLTWDVASSTFNFKGFTWLGVPGDTPDAAENFYIFLPYDDDATHQGLFQIEGDAGMLFQAGYGDAIASGPKVGFFGALINRPTTGSASATFVANAGTAINSASTFDGYTLAKVVKALRDYGLLA